MKRAITRLGLPSREILSSVFSLQRWRGTLRLPLFTNALYLIVNSAASAALNGLFWIVVARLYSSEIFGLVSALFSVTGLLIFIATLGLGMGMVRFLPSAGANSVALINSCFTLSGAVAVAVAIAFLVGLPLWSPGLAFVREDAIFSVAFVVFAATGTIYSILDPSLAGLRQVRLSVIMTVLRGLLGALLAIIMVMAHHSSVFAIFMSGGLASAASMVLGIVLFLPRLMPGYRPLPSLRRQVTGEMLRFSFANFVSTGLWQAPSWLLPLLVVNIAGGEANAYFFTSWGVAGLLSVIPFAIGTSLFIEGSYQDQFLARDVKRGLKFIAVLLLPAIAVTLFTGDKVLLLFGKQYSAEGVDVLRVVALSSLPMTANIIYLTKARVKKNLREIILVSAAIALGTLIFSYVLMPTMGILGAAVGSLVSHSLTALAVLPSIVKVLRFDPTKVLPTGKKE